MVTKAKQARQYHEKRFGFVLRKIDEKNKLLLTPEEKEKIIVALYDAKPLMKLLGDALWRIPMEKETIDPKQVDDWYRAHAHSDEYTGCIKGHVSTTTIHTTLGDVRRLNCGWCGAEALVDDPL